MGIRWLAARRARAPEAWWKTLIYRRVSSSRAMVGNPAPDAPSSRSPKPLKQNGLAQCRESLTAIFDN